MKLEAETLARRTAGRLAPQLGANLPASVEAVLHGDAETSQRYDPTTLIALATLVLNIAKFAWDIWKDTKKSGAPSPSPEVVARRIRLEVTLPDGVTSGQRDHIIAAVVDELPKL
jgi:hypothetical protein